MTHSSPKHDYSDICIFVQDAIARFELSKGMTYYTTKMTLNET